MKLKSNYIYFGTFLSQILSKFIISNLIIIYPRANLVLLINIKKVNIKMVLMKFKKTKKEIISKHNNKYQSYWNLYMIVYSLMIIYARADCSTQFSVDSSFNQYLDPMT